MARNSQNQSEEQDNVRSLLPYLGGTALLGMYVDKNYMPKANDWERFKASYSKWLSQSIDPEYKYQTPELYLEVRLDQTYGDMGLNLKNIKLADTVYDSQQTAKNLGTLGAKVLRTFAKTNPYPVTIGGQVVNEKLAEALYKKGFGFDPLDHNMVRSQNASEFEPGVLEIGGRHVYLDPEVRAEYDLVPFTADPTLRQSKLGGGNFAAEDFTSEQIDKAIAFNQKTSNIPRPLVERGYDVYEKALGLSVPALPDLKSAESQYSKRAFLSSPMTRIAAPLGLIAGGTLAYAYSKIRGDSDEEAQKNAAQFAGGGGLLGMYQPANQKIMQIGFTRAPALTSILGTGVGATAGNAIFRSVARSLGLDEEQQQTAGNIGSVVGGFTGGTLGYGRNPDLKAPTLQDFAKAIATRNSDAGAVYLFGGSRTAAQMPGEVEKTLDNMLAGDRKPFLVLGDASGTDKIALDYAKSKNIPYQVMSADWSQGTMGGTKRDYEAVMAAKQISDTGYFGDRGDVKAHYFSVDKSMGTQHMANAALAYDIPTKMTHVESNLDRIVSVQEDLPSQVRSKVEKLLAQGIEPRESLVYASDKPIKKSDKVISLKRENRPLEYKVFDPVDAVYQKGTADYDAALRAHAESFKLSDEAIASLQRFAPAPRFMPAEEHARLQLFKGLRGTGLDLTQMARLSVPGVIPNPKDDLTGFIRGIEGRDQTAKRAIEFTQKTGEVGHYVSADIANLGGLNSTLGETGANKVYKRFTDIYAEELKSAGDRVGTKDFSLSNFRQGGDEFSSIVYGLKPEQIDEAVGRAQYRIQEFVKTEGLDAIEHPKYKGDVTRRGTGITTAYAPLDPARSIEETYGIVDKQLEANKKLVRQSLDRRDVERPAMAQALDLPYNIDTGDILDADKFVSHLEAMPAYEQTSLLDRLARASSAEANSWKQGLPKEQINSIQKQLRLESKVEARPDWSKLALEDAPLQPGILSGARQNQYKSAKLRGEKPPNLAYFLGGEPGVAIAETVDKFVKSSQQSLKSGYIPQPEFDARVSAIAQKTGVPELNARSALAQGRDIEGATQILSERLPPKPILSMRQAKQTIAEMQQKYSGGRVGTPDIAIAPRTGGDRLAQSLKSNASYINQVAGEIGLEALQGADYAAKSLRRGENLETAIARAGTASATSIGASRIIGASLAKAPLPGIVKVGAQFVGAGLAAFGADELISNVIGFDAQKAQRYQEREMRALGETEGDRNQYSFQYVYNQATEGNQIADTIRPATDIAGSIIDSFNPVHIAKNLGESLANYTNRDSIQQSMYLNQRSDSMDATMKLKPEKGVDNAVRSRALALQNLVNESGQSVQRTGKFDADTYEALTKQGYSQQQIQDYLRGKTKVLGKPMVSDRYRQVGRKALASSQGKQAYTPTVTGQTLSEALSQVRKSANLKPGQKLDAGTVQGVFEKLVGKSSLAGGFR